MIDNNTMMRIAERATRRKDYLPLVNLINQAHVQGLAYMGAFYEIGYAQGKHDARKRRRRWDAVRRVLKRITAKRIPGELR